jgi:hypothetical protein
MAAPATIGYTDLAAVQAGGANILANLLDPNFTFGRLKEIEATYTMTGNEAANDAVYIARIPGGCLPSAVNGSIASVGGAPAATMTTQIGDTDTKGGTGSYDPARYSAAVDTHAQTTTTPVGFSGGTELVTNAPQQPVVDDWCWLIATFATLVTPSAGKKLVFRIQIKALD